MQLLPTRAQAQAALVVATEATTRLAGRMDVIYVLPDYYEAVPKPCMQGWGRRYLTVNPIGDVLPCPNATSIAGLQFTNVRARSLDWIWNDSPAFQRFRGTEWMPYPCKECPRQEIDFGGCRCQAAILAGDATLTDPVCQLSPVRSVVDDILAQIESEPVTPWTARRNPGATAAT
jgi:pyrroloquinoline quinone biosynthesis protein E